jgi:hydroxymethylglutaryl-CoA lyase
VNVPPTDREPPWAPVPFAVPAAGQPPAVTLYEVGARDGLQNEPVAVDTATKVEFIRRLATAGARTIEATSFVRPEWVPQLADAEAVLDQLAASDATRGVSLPVLVPNLRGYERARDRSDIDTIALFVSATESFSRRNLNASIAKSLEDAETVAAAARADGRSVRGYISMCFADPWEGPTPIEQVVRTGQQLIAMGCYQLSLGDTIGVATPGHVVALLQAFAAAGTPMSQLAVHFHDTYGQALANASAALQVGVTTFDASAGGLGGCPFARNATGNLATEDLVWMLHGLGIDSGLDLPTLVRTSRWMAERLGRPSNSRVVAAFAPELLEAPPARPVTA